jgi:hypothetical protein
MKKTLFASLLLVCSIAQAQYQNGNNLYADLTAKTTVEQMFALGYIIGVTDSFIRREVCPPTDVTQGQLLDVVTNYLANRPQIRHQPADLLVVLALRQHWPCREGKKS